MNVGPDHDGLGVALGVDYGSRRIGVAVSDALGIAARPLLTIDRRHVADPVATLVALVVEHQARHVVIGRPVKPDGSDGPLAAPAWDLALRLAGALRQAALDYQPIVRLLDEVNTSVVAVERLKDLGRWRTTNLGRPRDPGAIDSAAAAVLLEEWLASGPRYCGEIVTLGQADPLPTERSSSEGRLCSPSTAPEDGDREE